MPYDYGKKKPMKSTKKATSKRKPAAKMSPGKKRGMSLGG
jgi:hypothetical protein